MPTDNPRINVTLEPELAKIIQGLAKINKQTISNIAKELILDALESREDIALAKIAKIRDTTNKKTISHKNAWK